MDKIEQSRKFTAEQRYFNISVIWIFYFRAVLRLLYRLRVPHEAVTIFAIALGLLAACFFYEGRLIAAAVALHFKDIFDACDGALARMTGRGHLIGRYLDSVGDFVSLTAVLAAITVRAATYESNQYILWGIFGWLSLFIQCSFFNYYQLAYAELAGGKRLTSKRDENSRDDIDISAGSFWRRSSLTVLRFLYQVIYGWQDKLVAAVDRWLRMRSGCRSDRDWYGDKTLMTLQSPLCFGTHIFVIIVFAVMGKPGYALPFIAIIMNIYLIWVLLYRVHRGARHAGVSGTAE